MQLNLLHLDDALKAQPRFLEQCRMLQARETEAAQQAAPVRLWGKTAAIDTLRQRISSSLAYSGNGTTVTFMGSGDFHHVSALLIGVLAEGQDGGVTVIHFDNHPDWVHFSGGMHCGSWVNKALSIPQVERVITIGVCSRDLIWPQFKKANLDALAEQKIILLPWRSPGKRFRAGDIEPVQHDIFLARLEALIPTRNVYITIDKDVLAHDDAITNWDQGLMTLDYLMTTLRFVLSRHHALGIDVNGDYSPAQYGGSVRDVLMKKLESFADQPRHAPDAMRAASVNQTSNLALLGCIREAL
jgi:arginase family enzyme